MQRTRLFVSGPEPPKIGIMIHVLLSADRLQWKKTHKVSLPRPSLDRSADKHAQLRGSCAPHLDLQLKTEDT